MALQGEAERCNLEKNCSKFEALKNMLYPRYGSAVVWSSEMEEILVIGGFGIDGNCRHSSCRIGKQGATGVVEGYHVSSMSWIERPPLKTPRSFVGASELHVDSGAANTFHWEIFAIGGVSNTGIKRTSSVEMFRCYTANCGTACKFHYGIIAITIINLLRLLQCNV